MRIAAAQIEAKVGDVEANLTRHLKMIDLAGANAVDLIIFPEMSLTGYCREEAKDLVVKLSDPEVLKLKGKSKAYSITIVVGVPIEIDEALYIASLIISPSGKVEVYTKQFLHAGEEVAFSASFEFNAQIRLEQEVVSLAICADINSEIHPKNAKDSNCSMYAASIFYTESGIEEGHEVLAQYASEHSFCVLMSNYAGEVWGMKSGGKSAFWNQDGRLIAALDSVSQGLLMIEKSGERWMQVVL